MNLEKLKETLILVFGGTFALMIILTIAGAFLLAFSMMVNCFTGFDLVREVIRPFFQSLR